MKETFILCSETRQSGPVPAPRTQWTQAWHPWLLAILAFVYLSTASQAHAQGDFVYTSQESALRVSLDAPGGSTEWSPGSAYELAAHVFTESWEVWTHDVTGEIELRNFENTPMEGATVSFTLDSGDGNFTTTVLTSDVDGVTSTWLTLAGGSAVVRVEASPDGIALASTTAEVSCATPPEEDPGETPGDEPENQPEDDPAYIPEEWTYSHTETVIYPSLQFDDTGITLDAYTSSGVTASVIAHTWEVWTSNYGNTSVFNESQSPAEGAELSWSIESGDGSYNTSSGSTDTAGNATATFQMGGSSSVLRIDVTYAGSYTAYATLDASLPTTDDGTGDEGSGDEGTGDEGTTSEEEWTYSHTESSVSTAFAIADGTDPSLLVPGQSYTITTTVNYESWEVWTSNWGSTQWVNYSAGPASNIPVWMGLYSGGNWQSISSSFEYTDYNGQVQSTFTMTADPADFVSESNFYGTMALGSQYLHPGGTVDDGGDTGGGDTGGGDTGGGDTGGGDTGGGDTGGGDTGGGDTGGGDTGGGTTTTTTDTFTYSFTDQSVSLSLTWNGAGGFDTNLSVTTWEVWVDASGATDFRNWNYGTAYTPEVYITSEADVTDPNYTIFNATASFGGQTATASGRAYNGSDNGGGDTGGGDNGGGGDTGDGDDEEDGGTCSVP